MSFTTYWTNHPELPWQWFNWPPFGPPPARFRYAFTTRTIWKPGSVPFRLLAWQPDVTSRTLARFSYDCRNWSQTRLSPPTRPIDLDTGSVVISPP